MPRRNSLPESPAVFRSVLDTAGEFVRWLGNRVFRSPADPILPKFRPIGLLLDSPTVSVHIPIVDFSRIRASRACSCMALPACLGRGTRLPLSGIFEYPKEPLATI